MATSHLTPHFWLSHYSNTGGLMGMTDWRVSVMFRSQHQNVKNSYSDRRVLGLRQGNSIRECDLKRERTRDHRWGPDWKTALLWGGFLSPTTSGQGSSSASPRLRCKIRAGLYRSNPLPRLARINNLSKLLKSNVNVSLLCCTPKANIILCQL